MPATSPRPFHRGMNTQYTQYGQQPQPSDSPSIPKPPTRYYPSSGASQTSRGAAQPGLQPVANPVAPSAATGRSSGPRHSAAVRPPMRLADANPARLPETAIDTADGGNIILCLSASGGVGLSVCASMLALALSERGHACALMDADRTRGGLDVLLGLEREQGMRMSDVEAPLGRFEGDALRQELPKWGNVSVLAADPWNGEPAQWWELEAAVAALSQVHDLVVVDGGDGRGLEQVPSLARAAILLVVEMSVLGLARARTLIGGIGGPVRTGDTAGPLWLLGVHPRGMPRRAPRLDAGQAEAYLHHRVEDAIEPKPSLCAALLDGMGIERIPREYRKTYDALAELVERETGHARGTA